MEADHHQLPHLVLSWHGSKPSVHLFRDGLVRFHDGAVRYGSYLLLLCLTLMLASSCTNGSNYQAMPHRARRKNWFISPRNSLLLMQYDSYGPLYVFLSTHTHSSPFDPNSMILYYTLYNSSFPHDKSKFLYWILIIGLYSENSWILYKIKILRIVCKVMLTIAEAIKVSSHSWLVGFYFYIVIP